MGIELRGGITLKRQPPKWGINQLITPKEYFASTIYTRYTTSGRTGLQISIDFLRFLVQAPPISIQDFPSPTTLTYLRRDKNPKMFIAKILLKKHPHDFFGGICHTKNVYVQHIFGESSM